MVAGRRRVPREHDPALVRGAYVAWPSSRVPTFFACLLLHELGHALQARREDMAIEGITLWLFGGVARFRGMFPSAGAEFRIAIAGPLVTLALGVRVRSALALAAAAPGGGRRGRAAGSVRQPPAARVQPAAGAAARRRARAARRAVAASRATSPPPRAPPPRSGGRSARSSIAGGVFLRARHRRASAASGSR